MYVARAPSPARLPTLKAPCGGSHPFDKLRVGSRLSHHCLHHQPGFFHNFIFRL
jgi:hypothetical protein